MPTLLREAFYPSTMIIKLDTLKLFKIQQELNSAILPEIPKVFYNVPLKRPTNQTELVYSRDNTMLLKEINLDACYAIIVELMKKYVDLSLLTPEIKAKKMIPLYLPIYLKVEKAIRYLEYSGKGPQEYLNNIYNGFIFRSSGYNISTGVCKVINNDIVKVQRSDDPNAYVLWFLDNPSYSYPSPSPRSILDPKDEKKFFSCYTLYLFIKDQFVKYKHLLDFYEENKETIDEFLNKESKESKEKRKHYRWIIPGRGDVCVS